jgi:hypothetical protein
VRVWKGRLIIGWSPETVYLSDLDVMPLEYRDNVTMIDKSTEHIREVFFVVDPEMT